MIKVFTSTKMQVWASQISPICDISNNSKCSNVYVCVLQYLAEAHRALSGIFCSLRRQCIPFAEDDESLSGGKKIARQS